MSLDALKKLYYDPAQGLLSENKLYQKARSKGIWVTHKQVRDFLSKQELAQVHTQRRIKHYFPLQAYYPFQRVQCDLADLSNKASRGYKWIFCCVDVYTRYALCFPMKTKNEGDCTTAFQDILQEIQHINGFLPEQVDSDKESSFRSSSFKQLCEDYGVRQHMTEINDFRRKGVVERFIRTLRGMINKYLTVYPKGDWSKELDTLVQNYNGTYHRTLHKAPVEALLNNDRFDRVTEQQDREARSQDFNKAEINVGDSVRLRIKRGIFEKEGAKFTKTVHKVESIDEGQYYVSDREHPYKKYELQLVTDVEQPEPISQADREEEEQVEDQSKRMRRTSRRIRKEGISPEKDIVTDENARVLRRFKPRQDLGFFITT